MARKPYDGEMTPEAAADALRGTPPATLDDYEQMLEDRPEKFEPEQVGFKQGGGTMGAGCGACVHFFKGTTRTVCEIVRLPDEADIQPTDSCRFYTPDGTAHPLLEEVRDSDEEG